YDITLMPTSADFDGDVIARKISTTEAILVASPDYLKRRGVPGIPQDLIKHEILRLKVPGLHAVTWRLFNAARQDEPLEVVVAPGLWINHSDTLVRAALDGAGITATAIDLVAPYLTRGELVRVLQPWISGRLSLYAALPSRKFLPERTRVFLEYLIAQTRAASSRALQACENC
ncbi:MAG: LysR family transcriptional regulator, partial [Candidatus Saccharibacteria bacterium]|nr:LysR family transcriptional regulator [Rhodoferax sp.]